MAPKGRPKAKAQAKSKAKAKARPCSMPNDCTFSIKTCELEMHAHTDHMQNVIGCQATISKVARAVFRKALTDGSAVRNAAKKDQASPYIHN